VGVVFTEDCVGELVPESVVVKKITTSLDVEMQTVRASTRVFCYADRACGDNFCRVLHAKSVLAGRRAAIFRTKVRNRPPPLLNCTVRLCGGAAWARRHGEATFSDRSWKATNNLTWPTKLRPKSRRSLRAGATNFVGRYMIHCSTVFRSGAAWSDVFSPSPQLAQ